MNINPMNTSYNKDTAFVKPASTSIGVKESIQATSTATNSDILEISDDAMEMLRKKAQESYEKKWAQEQAENLQQQGDAAADDAKYRMKMLKIAMRIASGGKVPGSDEKKLMEFSPELYEMAKNSAMMAKEHKEYDSVFEDEDETAADDEAKSESTASTSADIPDVETESSSTEAE